MPTNHTSLDNEMTLDQIEKELEAALISKEEVDWQIAGLLKKARTHFDATDEWLEWAKMKYRISRRKCFHMMSAIEVVNRIDKLPKVRGAHLQMLCAEPVNILAELAPIPVENLADFLASYDITTSTRDDLRIAVSKFLGRETSEISRLFPRLPDPAKLLSAIHIPEAMERVDIESEHNYKVAFGTRSLHRAVALQKFDYLRRVRKENSAENEEINRCLLRNTQDL